MISFVRVITKTDTTRNIAIVQCDRHLFYTEPYLKICHFSLLQSFYQVLHVVNQVKPKGILRINFLQ